MEMDIIDKWIPIYITLFVHKKIMVHLLKKVFHCDYRLNYLLEKRSVNIMSSL